MISGVARKKGRGIPPCLFQEEQTRTEDKLKAKWTLKVASLKGDAAMPGMVAISLYDSKPFYMISNICRHVHWVKKKKSVSQGIEKNG